MTVPLRIRFTVATENTPLLMQASSMSLPSRYLMQVFVKDCKENCTGTEIKNRFGSPVLFKSGKAAVMTQSHTVSMTPKNWYFEAVLTPGTSRFVNIFLFWVHFNQKFFFNN